VTPSALLAVALGGAIGSVARYVTASEVGRLAGVGFPWGTLAVNIVGGLAIGAFAGLAAARLDLSSELRLFLVTGILGGFTTFSAFSLEVVLLIERHQWAAAIAYAGASVIGSVGAALAGLWLMRGAT